MSDKEDLQDWTEPDDDVAPPAEPPPRRRRFRLAVRLLVWLLEALGAIVGATVLALMLIAARLEFGPIEVDFLTPMLVAYLNARADPLSVDVERTSLNWTVGRSTIDVIAAGTRIADASGSNVISIPELSASVNLRALLAGSVAFSRIVLSGPKVQLVRTTTGEVGVDLSAHVPGFSPEPVLAEAPQSLQELWDAFAGKPSPDRSLGYLDRIGIERADIEVDDRHLGLIWHVDDGSINLTRRAAGLDADLYGGFGLGQAETRIFGHFRYTNQGRRLDFALGWDAVDPSVFAAALPAPYDSAAAELRLPISGEASGDIALGEAVPGPLQLRIDAGPGVVIDPFLSGGRLDLTSLSFNLDYAPDEHRLKLDRLKLDLGGPSIELSGAVDRIPPDLLNLVGGIAPPAMSASADITLHAMPIDKLPGFWPPDLSAHTRTWIQSNLSSGSIDTLHATANMAIDPAGTRKFQVSSFGGTLAVKGTSVEYMHGLPHVDGVDAVMTFQPKKLDFAISAGHLKSLSLSQGSVVIDELDQPFERATIDLTLAGPAQDVMTLLDTKPLQYARALGVDPRQFGGAVDGTVHFRFPLKNSLPLAEIEYGASAKLTGFSLSRAAMGRDLSDGNFALTLDRDNVGLVGTGKLDGIGGEIGWRQRLTAGPGARAETHVKTVIDDVARKRLGLDFAPNALQGPVGADLTYTEYADHRARAAVALDLGATALTVDDLDWRKPAGSAAHADFTAEFADGHLTRLTGLSARAPRLEIKAELGFAADGRLAELHAPKFRLGETDAALSILHPGNTWQVALHGPVLDLSEKLKQFKDRPDTKPQPDAADPGPTVELDLQNEQIILGPGHALNNAKVTATFANHTLAHGQLTAALGGAGKVEFRLDPLEEGGKFRLAADDFGALLATADVSDNVVGGKLTIEGRAAAEGKGRRFTGRAEGSDYRFTGAPFLVRLLSIASLSSIQTLLNGEGIPFSALKADLSLYDGKLTLSHARAYGGAMGVNVDGSFDLDAGKLDLDGTLVPAYTLNSALGNLPILGDLLTGGEGQGLFSANFRMAGQTDSPSISVNPLSPLAPGILRKLFLFDAPEPQAAQPKEK